MKVGDEMQRAAEAVTRGGIAGPRYGGSALKFPSTRIIPLPWRAT
jgi:hypothetical protein